MEDFPEKTQPWNTCQKLTFIMTLQGRHRIYKQERQQYWVMLGCLHIYSCEMCCLNKGAKAAKCTLTKLLCWQLCPGTTGTSKSSSHGIHVFNTSIFTLILCLIIHVFLLSVLSHYLLFFCAHSWKEDCISVLCPLKITSKNTYWYYVCTLCWFYALVIIKYCKKLQKNWSKKQKTLRFLSRDYFFWIPFDIHYEFCI